MFDRLGRKEDETPFVVEWFVKNGVEVWSAMEGEQRFDNHVDKLMNYIRYWQASGESIKTSIRTKTRLGQIVQEGRFRGGISPYGYQLVKRGRIGKKNKELFDLEINKDETVVIRRNFEKAANYGYGARRIASDLKDEGFLNRSGEMFHYSTIQNILKNIMYTGVLRSGDTRSEVFPELQIIDEATFERVTAIRQQRSNTYEERRNVPRKVMGNALLSGNVYCGHCGGRIFATTARKTHHAISGEAVNERIAIYKCYNRTRHKDLCDGPTTYRSDKVDAAVEEILNRVFLGVGNEHENDWVEKQYKAKTDEYSVKLKHAKADYAKLSKELSKLDSMMMDAMDGTCVFSPQDLQRRMQTIKESIAEVQGVIFSTERAMEDSHITLKRIQDECKQLATWAQVFHESSPDVKKMIASYMIERVTVSRDYEVNVDLNITESQFFGGMKMEL
jgi:site-specific DNA recombinase